MPVSVAILACLVLAVAAAVVGRRRGDRRWYVVAAVLALAGFGLVAALGAALSTM